MQPAFLPWQGLLELAAISDRFVFLDDFQFSVQSWHQRNRLFSSPGRVDWYTVPVARASFGAPLTSTRIDETQPWRVKMWKRIVQNYRRAPFFADLAERVEGWLLGSWDSLADQNIAFIELACHAMAITPEFRRSSDRPSGLTRSERVFDLLRWCEADTYHCARGSFGYMAEDGAFPVAGIEVVFQDYVCRPYPQVGSETFEPCLSVLDALFNVGPAATRELIEGGTARWSSWDEMREGLA